MAASNNQLRLIVVLVIVVIAFLSAYIATNGFREGGGAVKSEAEQVASEPARQSAKAASLLLAPRNSATTVSNPTQPSMAAISTTPPPPFGERTVATVTSGGIKQVLAVDQMGHFPRVYIQPRQIVPVKIHFPEAEPGEVAVVRVEDGGHLENGVPSRAAKLDTDKNIAFIFQANADLGVYHVVVQKGGEDRVLDFWAGPETPLANR